MGKLSPTQIAVVSIHITPTSGQGKTAPSGFWDKAAPEKFDLIRRYCQIHGYQSVCISSGPRIEQDRDSTAWWFKDIAIKRAWNQGALWVLWTDIDSHFSKPRIALQSFIKRASKRECIIGSPPKKGPLKLFCGDFLIKNCSLTRKLVAQTYQYGNREGYDGAGDTGAFNEHVEKMEAWDRVAIIPRPDFVSTPGEADSFLNHYTTSGRKKQWIRDLPIAQRKMLMAEIGDPT